VRLGGPALGVRLRLPLGVRPGGLATIAAWLDVAVCGTDLSTLLCVLGADSDREHRGRGDEQRDERSAEAAHQTQAARNDPLLTIGQVAERAGLNTSHIRFYERTGVLPQPERVSGQRRYREEVLHRLSIIDVAQRAGLTLEEIAPLTGPDNRSADAARHIRKLADEKLPQIDALIARAQAVKRWLQVAHSCDCASVDVCGLFVDPTLTPPAPSPTSEIHRVGQTSLAG
jgi:MerR family transcriptional regulator, redox-sensitive transcriptional activator SoxR